MCVWRNKPINSQHTAINLCCRNEFILKDNCGKSIDINSKQILAWWWDTITNLVHITANNIIENLIAYLMSPSRKHSSRGSFEIIVIGSLMLGFRSTSILWMMLCASDNQVCNYIPHIMMMCRSSAKCHMCVHWCSMWKQTPHTHSLLMISIKIFSQVDGDETRGWLLMGVAITKYINWVNCQRASDMFT